MKNHNKMLDKILKIIKSAGEIAIARQEELSVYTKQDNSLVTNTDLELSKFILEEIKEFTDLPNHTYLDEEDFDKHKQQTFEKIKNSEYVWYIDPIAGTTSYAAKLPIYAVSIGVFKNNKPYIGAIYLPSLQELYYTDGKASFFVRNPFTDFEQKDSISMPKQTSDILYTTSSSQAFKKYNLLDTHLNVWRIPVINPALVWTGMGKVKATLFNVKIWDIAASWSILKNIGINLYDADSGKIVEEFSDEFFTEEFRMKNYFIACIPSLKDEVVNDIKK